MKKILSAILLLLIGIPSPLWAAVFNPNNIISDEALVDYRSMSRDRIQRFLNNKTGVLKQYAQSVFGLKKTAADIIFESAQAYKINPKYLLVLLQKEQSLITDSDPSQSQLDWATGYAVCDSCSKTDPAIQKYRGFFNQVNWAARRNRQYITEAGRWHYVVGGRYLIDGVAVTIENQATVNLYTYTPHIHGNQVFHRLWHDWFSLKYPDGSLLQVKSKPAVYLIQHGRKRAFWSKSAFLASYNPINIIAVEQSDVDAFDDGPPIRFADYSLLQGPDQKIYLINGETKRLIESNKVFRKIGYNPEEVIPVESADLKAYQTSEPITLTSIYPTGALLQSKTTGGVFFVKNGAKHPIWSREILKSNFPNPTIIPVDDSELAHYKKSAPLLFKEGALVTSPSSKAVYVISNGQRRKIKSAEVFNRLGFKWQNIITTTDKALQIHPAGPNLNL